MICDERCLVENMDLALRSRRYEEGTELSRPSRPLMSVCGGGRSNSATQGRKPDSVVWCGVKWGTGGTAGAEETEKPSSVPCRLEFGRRLGTAICVGPPKRSYEFLESVDDRSPERMAFEAAAAAWALATFGSMMPTPGRGVLRIEREDMDRRKRSFVVNEENILRIYAVYRVCQWRCDETKCWMYLQGGTQETVPAGQVRGAHGW